MNRIYAYAALAELKKEIKNLTQNHFVNNTEAVMQEANATLRATCKDMLLWMSLLQKGKIDQEDLTLLVDSQELDSFQQNLLKSFAADTVEQYYERLKSTILHCLYQVKTGSFSASNLSATRRALAAASTGYFL